MSISLGKVKRFFILEKEFSDENNRFNIHKPQISRISKQSETMRNYWKQKRLDYLGRNNRVLGKFSDFNIKLSEDEMRRRERNRKNTGELAIIERVKNRADARKLAAREALEHEIKLLNSIVMERKLQNMSARARKMGIRPSSVGTIKI